MLTNQCWEDAMDKSTLSSHQLMEQASSTVQAYLSCAHEYINSKFGSGYAERNPALVGCFIIACALDFATCMAASVYQDTQDILSDRAAALEKVAESAANIEIAINDVGGVIENLSKSEKS
jgi:hypothetical protein